MKKAEFKQKWEEYYSMVGGIGLYAIIFFILNCVYFALFAADAGPFIKLIVPFTMNILGYIYFVLTYSCTKYGIQLRYDEYNYYYDLDDDEEDEWNTIKPMGFIAIEFHACLFIIQSLNILIACLYLVFSYPYQENELIDLMKIAPFVIITVIAYAKTIYNWIEMESLKDDYRTYFKGKYHRHNL